MEYSQEVRKLAETLRNSGLAASMVDALEKARSMLGKRVEEETKEESFKEEIDATQTTLDEVKKSEEKVIDDSEELKKEEVFVNKTDTEQKKEDSNQKKVD